MTEKRINSFADYLAIVDKMVKKKPHLILYRGQSNNYSLIPSVARKNPQVNTTNIEKQMLDELIRTSQTVVRNQNFDKWEWLIYAQHFGMKTRLLDWTTNPLIALWFACFNEYKNTQDSFVYVFGGAQDYMLDKSIYADPFMPSKTMVFKPTMNNERIVAQAGWFTAHQYSKKARRFVDLRTNLEIKNNIMEITIPAAIKPNIIENLNVFGINNRTVFPDIIGICKHLNWENDI
ncbi:MAG: FRG domain-containing protein [Bacteroidetes bacterium]|nr:FRG domain-containing protein [Bacteroidota bacterium]